MIVQRRKEMGYIDSENKERGGGTLIVKRRKEMGGTLIVKRRKEMGVH